MKFSNLVTRTLLASSLVLAGACVHSVPEAPDRTYYLEVTNDMSHQMNVSLDIGKGTQVLGSVDANATRRFEINSPGTDSVQMMATDQGRTHEVTKELDLDKNQVVKVKLSQ